MSLCEGFSDRTVWTLRGYVHGVCMAWRKESISAASSACVAEKEADSAWHTCQTTSHMTTQSFIGHIQNSEPSYVVRAKRSITLSCDQQFCDLHTQIAGGWPGCVKSPCYRISPFTFLLIEWMDGCCGDPIFGTSYLCKAETSRC